MKLNEIILNQSKPIMVVDYDETVVRSWYRYLKIKYFITDRAMRPSKFKNVWGTDLPNHAKGTGVTLSNALHFDVLIKGKVFLTA